VLQYHVWHFVCNVRLGSLLLHLAMHTLVVKAAFVSSSMPSQHSDTQLDTDWYRSALCVSVHMQPSHSNIYMLSFYQSDSHP